MTDPDLQRGPPTTALSSESALTPTGSSLPSPHPSTDAALPAPAKAALTALPPVPTLEPPLMLTKCCTENIPCSDHRPQIPKSLLPRPGVSVPGSSNLHAAPGGLTDHPGLRPPPPPSPPQTAPPLTKPRGHPSSQSSQPWPAGCGFNCSPDPPTPPSPEPPPPQGLRTPPLPLGPVSPAARASLCRGTGPEPRWSPRGSASPGTTPVPPHRHPTPASALTCPGQAHSHLRAFAHAAPAAGKALPSRLCLAAPSHPTASPQASPHVPRTRPSSPQAPCSSGRGGEGVRGEPGSEQPGHGRLPQGPPAQRMARHCDSHPPPPSSPPSGRRARCLPLGRWMHQALLGDKGRLTTPSPRLISANTMAGGGASSTQ